MPAAFFGHGSPMNTLEHNRYTEAWNQFGQRVGTPRAVLAISAHWFINATAVTSMATPRVIHDFYGFPQELFDFDYPAPGAPDVAREIADLVEPTFCALDDETWGIDHGTWSVLAHMFPDANVPVVQLAIDASKPTSYHVDLGAQLAPLLDRGVLIVASGNVVHNLRAIAWGAEEQGFDWAHRFDDDAKEVLTQRPGDFATLESHHDYRMAVPTADHFLPAAYLAGIALATGTPVATELSGCTMGSLSMTSYSVTPSA
jgi:4,5-DOPA dioxygenase extradiol